MRRGTSASTLKGILHGLPYRLCYQRLGLLHALLHASNNLRNMMVERATCGKTMLRRRSGPSHHAWKLYMDIQRLVCQPKQGSTVTHPSGMEVCVPL